MELDCSPSETFAEVGSPGPFAAVGDEQVCQSAFLESFHPYDFCIYPIKSHDI